MKKFIGIGICVIFSILQIAIVAGLHILDSLSLKKAGVNHHLMVKKYFYEHWIFNERNTYIMYVILFVLVIFLLVFFVKRLKKNGWYRKWVYLCSVVICFVGFWQLSSEEFHQKLAYPYMIMGAGVILLLELIEIVVVEKLVYRKK